MWIVLPLLPILIGILCIALGLFGEIQSNLETINTVVMIIVAIVFIGIAIYNLTCKISNLRKIFSTIACGICGIISAVVMNFFIQALMEIEFGILGLIEFVFVLCVGGGICLLIVVGCINLCCWFND